MKGDLTIIPADSDAPVTSKWADIPLTLLDLKHAIDGGYIEVVPDFKRFADKDCVAFCDEDGKRKELPRNERATAIWHRQAPQFIGRDVLVGPVVIVTGDAEFMEEL